MSPAVEAASGDRLQQQIMSLWHPAFIRFDQLNAKEDNLLEIINDLTGLQGIGHVLIFDPSGRHQMALTAIGAVSRGANRYRKDGTDIISCRTLEEVTAIHAS